MAETCVFAKQSLGPFHCGLLAQAPLLPKLRGHVAEFLNESSPARLRILSSPTCVGFRYGHCTPPQRLFLAVWVSELRYCIFAPHPPSRFRAADLPATPSQGLDGLFHPAALLTLLRPPIGHTVYSGTGISTRCPSRTPFGLRLGPDLPWVDEPSPGTLRLSADKILTCLFATHTGILTSWRSNALSKAPSPPQERSPTPAVSPIGIRASQSFGGRFSPVTFSAQRHSTSELLRTLSMVAASKPTSWLSVHRHIVSHSTGTSGP